MRSTRPFWRSLRGQLALLGFLAIYVPVLLLLGVVIATEDESTVTIDGAQVVAATSTDRSPWTTWTVVGLAPVAGGLAWWLAGRAVRPLDRVRAVAEDIEATDLTRRIDLHRGPVEIVALAASFDAMLDRLDRAAQAQRQLIEQTSHELRTPLSILTTNADVLLAHPAPTIDVYRQGIERSRAAATRMQLTVDELLVDARGRARTIDRRPVDLMAVAASVVDDARVLAAARGIQLTIDGPATVVGALDEATVRRALSNLVDNAIRYAPRGSAVDVRVEMSQTEASVIVTDHGPGVSADERDHIFERFWRGRPDTPGTGLGLPIARQVALAHGGDLTVESPGPAGDGCVFVLTLRL